MTGKHVAAIIIGAIQFGFLWLVVAILFFGWSISLSIGAMFLRALPGIILGVIIGAKWPKVPLALCCISIGEI